jgi:hypothetical protein
MKPLNSEIAKKIVNHSPSYFNILAIGVAVLIVDTLLTKASAIISSLLFSKTNAFSNDELRNHSASSFKRSLEKNSICCITIIPF